MICTIAPGAWILDDASMAGLILLGVVIGLVGGLALALMIRRR